MHAPSATNLRHRTTCFTGDPSGVCCLGKVSCVSVRSRADCSIPTIGNDQQQPTWYALTRREQRAITAGPGGRATAGRGRTTTGHAARLYGSQEMTHAIGGCPTTRALGTSEAHGCCGCGEIALQNFWKADKRWWASAGLGGHTRLAALGAVAYSNFGRWGYRQATSFQPGAQPRLPSTGVSCPQVHPRGRRCVTTSAHALSQLRAPAHLPSLARAFHGHRYQ